MATAPAFAATPKLGIAQIATAEASRTAPTQVGTVLTGGASGTRISKILITAAATTTAGMVRLWLHDGSSYRLLKEVPVTAITASATVAAFSYHMSDATNPELLPLVLPSSSWTLRASTEKSETINVIANGADL